MFAACDTENKQEFAAKSPFQQTQINGWVLVLFCFLVCAFFWWFFFFFQLSEQRQIIIFRLLIMTVVRLGNRCDEKSSERHATGPLTAS